MPMEHFRARLNAHQNMRAETDSLGTQEILAALPPLDPNAADIGDLPPPDPMPKLIGNALQAFNLAFEPLRRLHQFGRESVLYLSNRTINFDTYKRRVSEAFKGNIQMSSKEFGVTLLGKEKWEAMENTPWIPGWAAPLMEPEAGVVRKVKSGMRFSLADLWSLGMDTMVSDPTTYMALTPTGVIGKIGTMVSKVPVAGKIATFPFKAPTMVVSKVFGPRTASPLAFINHARQPEDVLPRPIFEALKIGADDWMGATHDAWVAHQKLVGKKLKYLSETDHKIGRALAVGSTKGLNANERQLYSSVKDFLQNHLDELAERSPDVLKEVGLKKGQRLSLDALYHSFSKKPSIPMDIWQSWSAKNIGRIWLGMSKRSAARRGMEMATPATAADRFSAIELTRDLLFTIKKKQHLEPALVKYAPKVRKGAREGLTKARLEAGEDILTAEMSRTQRRYYTDLANAFTGNARGRKMIEFDLALAEFWDKLAQTPVFSRVDKLFRKMGYGTKEGLPDFSTTSKIAGIWTGNIVQNILGLRLKSALVNSTQTLNFAVAKGLPSTIKGMMKFHGSLLGFDRGVFKAMRKEAELLGDYKALWTDDVWIRGVGKTWSNFLMGPFNLMENLIRGTGFHVGIDDFLKTNKLTMKQVMADPNLRRKMIQHAHFESSNGAFIYGTLGRPPALSNPLMRPTTTLLSFPFKQGEFLRREIVKDGGALLRFLGLHGWLIQRSNEWIGVAAEDQIGWGFKPMTRSFGGVPMVTSPPVQFLLNSAEALSAVADGNYKLASRKFDESVEALPILFSPIRFPWLQVREVFGDPMTGKQGLMDMWNTKQKELSNGGYVDIARDEVIINLLFGRSTIQKERANLKTDQIRALRKRDYVLTTRIEKWMEALEDNDGDKMGQATWELVQPITLKYQGNVREFYPDPDLIFQRLDAKIEKKQVSQDILNMYNNQFLHQIFLQAQLELFDKVEAKK